MGGESWAWPPALGWTSVNGVEMVFVEASDPEGYGV
jgi:hypothetical protein